MPNPPIQIIHNTHKTCTHALKQTHTHKYTHTHRAHTCTNLNTHTHTHLNTHTHIHMLTHSSHTHTHTHTHTHIPKLFDSHVLVLLACTSGYLELTVTNATGIHVHPIAPDTDCKHKHIIGSRLD